MSRQLPLMLAILTLGLGAFGQEKKDRPLTVEKASQKCADPIDKCKNPVKALPDDEDGCHVFVCKYGETDSFIIKVSDPGDRKILQKMALESVREAKVTRN